jgi:hypothetical protein
MMAAFILGIVGLDRLMVSGWLRRDGREPAPGPGRFG